MPNMQAKKTPMPTRDPLERAHDFEEVTVGYTDKMALSEAERCLNCKNRPCVSGCPVGISIPEFIAKVREGDVQAAYRIIARSSSLPAVCGRVCPQETQCEKNCVRGVRGEPVAIGRLERYVADRHSELSGEQGEQEKKPEVNGRRVAVVGSGPAGLACAGELAKRGYDVTVYEALHVPGGVLSYGIPEFRLPKRIVQDEVEQLKSLGVNIQTNTVIGRTFTVDELFEMGFEAVFIGSGAGLPRFMGIPGEQFKGVFSANEFLTRVNLMKAYLESSATPIAKGKKVAVVGGGNVAMDAARTALRLGAQKVYIIYRRGMEELPARKEEVEHAMEEGVEFRLLQNPVEILCHCGQPDQRGQSERTERLKERDSRNGWVRAIRCVRMELGEPDEQGRRKPAAIPGSEFDTEVDTVIMAIGTSPNPLIAQTTTGLETNRRGCIVVREHTAQTVRNSVYAGGDAVTGAATVILAMGAGKKAAEEIDRELKKK